MDWDLNTEYRYSDTRKDEQERLISIKSTPMSLILPDNKDKSYIFNLYDTPGHLNFSDEICSSLRICDGGLIVIDAVEGVMMGTERMIKYMITEGIKITVLVNKIDRLIVELKLPPADAYLKIKHTLEEVNALIASAAYNFPNKDDLKVK